MFEPCVKVATFNRLPKAKTLLSTVSQAKENQHYKTVQLELGEMKTKLEGSKAIEMENKKLHGLLLEKEKELKALNKVVEDQKNEKIELQQVMLNLFVNFFLYISKLTGK